MEKRRIKWITRAVPAILCGCVLAVWAAAPSTVRAFWNSDQAVHIDAADIENSTLAVGTHLIHLSALSDELYRLALESAQDSMQNQVFYKSEMADGTWFDITSASSLDDITAGGTPVEAGEIEKLFFEYHTKSDGVTYDLKTGAAVSIYDIKSPYDLESMKELEPIKLQYDMLNEEEQTEDGPKWVQGQLKNLFATDVKQESAQVVDEETGETKLYLGSDAGELDQTVTALEAYRSVLKENGGGEREQGAVSTVISSVDSSRRLISYEIVNDKVYGLLREFSKPGEKAEEGEGEEEGKSSDGKPEGITVDSGIVSAVNESIGNLSDAILTSQNAILDEGATLLTMKKYEYSNDLIRHAKEGNMAACDVDVEHLLALDDISNGTVVNQESELTLLDGGLLPEAERRYTAGLSAGENSEYMTAKAAQSASVLLRSIASDYESSVNTLRNELEFFIDARCMRISSDDAKAYLTGLIEIASGYRNHIPADRFADGCNASLDGYIEWLTQKMNRLVLGSGGTETDRMASEKEDLKKEYLKALDRGDLKTASGLEDEIGALTDAMEAMQEEQAQNYADLQSEIVDLKAQIEAVKGNQELLPGQIDAKVSELSRELAGKETEAAGVRAEMSSGSTGELISDLRAEALSLVKGNPGPEDLENLSNHIDSLDGMLDINYKAVFPALTDIHGAMTREQDISGGQTFQGLIEKIEDIILNNRAAYDSAAAQAKTPDAMMAVAGNLFGLPDSAQWDSAQNVVFLAAVQMYLEEMNGDGGGVQDVRDLLSYQAGRRNGMGDPSVFFRIGDPSDRYLPVTALSAHTGMRYVWNQPKSQATLALGNRFYEFSSFSDQVNVGKKASDRIKMDRPARFQGVIHVPVTYVYPEFGCDAIYLSGTDYGILVDDNLKEQARELLTLLLKGGV